MEERKYVFAFPLCLLTLNFNTWEKLQCIIAFGLFYGNSNPENFYLSKSKCDEPLIEELNINLVEYQKIYNFAAWYYEEYKKRQGDKEDAWVQINAQACFEIMRGPITGRESMTYDLFTLVCAVSSKIGRQDPYKIIFIEEIQQRMSGYVTEDAHYNVFKNPICNEDGEILSVSQNPYSHWNRMKLTRLRNKAVEKGFFTYYTYGRRKSYYSTRIKGTEYLAAEVLSKKQNARAKKNDSKDTVKRLEENFKAAKNNKEIKKVTPDELLKSVSEELKKPAWDIF